MKIVIAGAGEVGFNLIENLWKEDLDFLIIDTNEEVLKKLKKDFNVNTDHSSIIDSRYLHRSYLQTVDLFLAITNSDETNMIACKLASEAGVKKTICRIRQVNFSGSKQKASLDSLGIDVVINPVSLVAEELYRLVLAPNVVDSYPFFDKDIMLVGYNIHPPSTIIGKRIEELAKEMHRKLFRIAIIQRKEMFLIPRNEEEVIQDGDVVYFFCPSKKFVLLQEFLGYRKKKFRSKRVFINGGGHIGLRLAQRLEQERVKVKIIERDPARCQTISEKLENSLVLNFDGTDSKQLTAEGIEDADYFFSVTNNDSINLTSCLLACERNVERTICLIKQPEYSTILSKKTPISLGVSPRMLTSRYLTRFIQGRNVDSYFAPRNSQIEIFEIQLDSTLPCLNKPLMNLELPEDVRIGLIKRGPEHLLPTGDHTLQSGDRILLIVHRLDREEAMRFFQHTSS